MVHYARLRNLLTSYYCSKLLLIVFFYLKKTRLESIAKGGHGCDHYNLKFNNTKCGS